MYSYPFSIFYCMIYSSLFMDMIFPNSDRNKAHLFGGVY
jgi:hypothetical protein